MADILTIGIGGAAGDGTKEAGAALGTLLAELGYEVFMSIANPSLIRGGHNFARLSFGAEKIWCDRDKLDVLVALNEESITLHQDELSPNAVIFADELTPTVTAARGANAVALPMAATAIAIGAPAVARNSVALGALGYLLDLDLAGLQKILQRIFQNKKPELNLKLAQTGFEFLKKTGLAPLKKIKPGQTKKEFLDGNVAFAKGLLAAGLDFYVAYPMTPATSILHFLAGEQKNRKLKVIQPENELAAINLALGVAYAGKRVAVGSATGGFTLMQEAFSFAGGAELPLVVAVAQRQAPATGVPTFSSQADLRLAIHAGHGEFPRLVIAPGDPAEAFLAGAVGLNLAWQYQTPVIVLLDKIVSEHPATSQLTADQIKIESGKIAAKTGSDYRRYEITADGLSPLAFPGTPDIVVKITSYEHGEKGITTEDPELVKAMVNKRFAKAAALATEMVQQETVKIYGDQEAETAVIFWGSTKGPVLEAAKYFDRPLKLVQIVWLEPFDVGRVSAALAKVKKIINVEGNHNAQLAALIREKTGLEVSANILKYDSRPFDPIELAQQINLLNHE
ncbi:MAG TPA: 2-oxoacid:acceptor oxidoreductase subunit alpha [Candidatus Paceibacterota bacterium]